MGLGKTYSTKYLLDSNNNRGAEGQVLSTTSTGIDWVDANTIPGTGLWLVDGDDIYNSNSGFVGIGTTDPQNDLDIVSDDPTLLLRFDGAVNGANGGRIKFSEGGINHVGHMEIHYNGTTNKMNFNSPIDSTTGLLTIARTGNVDIPLYLRVGPNINNANTFDYSLQTRQLLVSGFSGTGASNLYLHRDDVTISTGNVIGNLNFSGQDAASNIGAQISAKAVSAWGATSAGSDIIFSNCASASNTLEQRMVIDSSGYVGIGEQDPGTRLDVFNGNDFTDTLDTSNMVRLKRQNNDGDGQVNGIYMGVSGNDGSSNAWAGIVAKQAGSTSNNTDLIFTTRGDSDSIQERMSIGSTGVVLINNSLGVNVTSVSTGYKLDIGGGDVYVRQAVAKISLGQFGSQGDAHFGASGIGSPTVGSQDYGFYSAHNAYRTSTGAWKHSRADAIGAVRILGSGGGSSGNAGFSFDYSANNGTNDITWTNLMHLSTGGNLQLPQYDSGILVSDGNGTITSSNSPSISGDIVMGDNLINYKFTSLENTATQYWLLCFNAGANDVNGTLIGDRSSGHHQAMNLDIVISAKSASMQTGMLTTKQVLEYNEKYTLVTLTYNTVSYLAIKYEGHPYPITGNGYFTGLLKSTIGTDFLLALNASQVSAVAAFSNANTKATIQADKVGIDTADPQSKLHVNSEDAEASLTLSRDGNNMVSGQGIGSIVFPADYNGTPTNYGKIVTYANALSALRGSIDFKVKSTSGNLLTGLTLYGTSSGVNVGINTTTPAYLLDVRNGTLSGAIARFSAVNAHVIIESSTAGPAVLHLKPNVTGNKSGQFKVTTGEGYNFRWSNDAASTAEVTYMKLDTSTTGGGDLTVKGDVIAYGAPSDERYKENIKPIESALDKALKLQGVTFDWKESDSILDIKEDIGFIAQDVQKVVPELVRENEDGKLSLRYQGITPILLEAIKELKAEIDLLKSKPCNCNNCNCSI